jgi:hypothetical protein
MNNIALTIAFGSCLFIVWSMPFLLLYFTGIRLYKITNKRQIPMIFSRISKTCSYTEDGNPRGWIWGKYYVGYIMEEKNTNSHGNSSTYSIFIVCTPKFFEDLTDPSSKMGLKKKNIVKPKNDKENLDSSSSDSDSSSSSDSDSSDSDSSDDELYNNKDKKKSKIKFYERQGNFFWLTYNNRDINVEKYIARDNQKAVISSLKKEYKKSSNVVSVIHGDPGSGKSMIPILLAKELNGYLCDSYNPTEPGDDIAIIYNTIMPTVEKPLILVLEEFDIIIHRIHNNLIQSHKHIPIQVKDKTSWNTLLDRIDRGLYPNMFFLLTSNSDPVIIDKLDSSYLRTGRVNSRYNL